MTRFPRDDYASLRRYAPDRRPVSVDLSDNRNLWGTHPAALEAVRNAVSDDLSCYPHLYADDLRAAVADRYGVDPRSVFTGCGSDDVLDFVFRACGTPGGALNHIAPTFSMVAPWARINGRTPVAIPWSEALHDPAVLLKGDPVLVYLCSPNNPTGFKAPYDWIAGIIAAVEARGDEAPLLLLDEAYADFTDETFIREASTSARLLVVRTLSKSYGLAGMRVGFGVARPDVAEEMEKARGPYKVARLSEIAATAALRDRSGWMEDTIVHAERSRRRLAEALEARGLRPLPSATNFLFVPVEDGSALAWSNALRERSVGVRPFPAAEEVGDALRITVGPWPLMETLLEAVDDLLAAGELRGAGAAAG